MGQQTPICEAQTTNTILGPFKVSGDHIVAISGVIGGATLSFFHKMYKTDGTTLVELAHDTTMSFTAIPAPFPYQFSPDLPLYVQIAGAGGSTGLNVTLFKVGK